MPAVHRMAVFYRQIYLKYFFTVTKKYLMTKKNKVKEKELMEKLIIIFLKC